MNILWNSPTRRRESAVCVLCASRGVCVCRVASLHVKFTYTLLQLYNLYTYSYIEHRERDSQESERAIESSTSSSPSALFFSNANTPLPQEEERIQTHKIQNKPHGRGTSPERDVRDPGVCGDRASYSVSFCVRSTNGSCARSCAGAVDTYWGRRRRAPRWTGGRGCRRRRR